jgi:hypothetical protein
LQPIVSNAVSQSLRFAAWNAINDPDLSADVGWVPTLRIHLDPAQLVARKVPEEAGPIGW